MKRRSFVKNMAKGTAALYIVPAHVMGGRHIAPSDTLYVAGFGVGGRGGQVVRELHKTRRVKFVAFCDVDEVRAGETYLKYPNVPRYRNYRDVYEKHLEDMDGIMVATPDHTHASIALPFMQAGKHAYVEKPLTHNIAEARLMAQVAEKNRLITQMGNQGSSGDGIRTLTEWMESEVIGKIHRVDCWTNRPVWPQGMAALPKGEAVPDTLDWDQWLGPAGHRPYSPSYLPFKWRGWWDFGTGALGDMGCHIMESPFKALKLGHPLGAEASCTTVWEGDFVESQNTEGCPPSAVVRLKFRTEQHGNIDLNWYDGGIMPERPEGLQEGEGIGSGDGGSVFYGERGVVVCDTYSMNPRILSVYRSQVGSLPKPYLPRQKENHVENWVNAVFNNGATSSPFSYGGPLTEAVLMGNLAIRAFQYRDPNAGRSGNTRPGRKTLLWDGERMKVLNFEKANDWVKGEYREGWTLG